MEPKTQNNSEWAENCLVGVKILQDCQGEGEGVQLKCNGERPSGAIQ